MDYWIKALYRYMSSAKYWPYQHYLGVRCLSYDYNLKTIVVNYEGGNLQEWIDGLGSGKMD